MTERLGQFRADLVHEGLDVLWHRRFPFPLIELIQSALLTFQNMAVNTICRSFRISRLQRADQVQMIAVDLLECSDIMTSAAGRENADQQSDAPQSLEASFVPRKLHDVRVKRQIGYLETFHLFFIEDRLPASLQFLDERGECRRDGAKVANLGRRRRASSDRPRRQTFQRLPHLEQLPDVVTVESDHHHAAPRNRFEEPLAHQLADRFARGRAADTQLLRNGDVGNRFAGAQQAGRDLALDVMVGYLAPGTGCLGCFGHGF